MARENESPTDVHVVHKTPGRKHVVKVTFPPGSRQQALIENREGTIHMRVPIDMVRKRMGEHEARAYFVAHLRDHGTLEIGDRAGEKESGW